MGENNCVLRVRGVGGVALVREAPSRKKGQCQSRLLPRAPDFYGEIMFALFGPDRSIPFLSMVAQRMKQL